MLEKYKYLKHLNNVVLYQLLEKTKLTDDEYWVLKYTLINKNLVENTCMRLSISKSTYRNIYNMALYKINETFERLIF